MHNILELSGKITRVLNAAEHLDDILQHDAHIIDPNHDVRKLLAPKRVHYSLVGRRIGCVCGHPVAATRFLFFSIPIINWLALQSHTKNSSHFCDRSLLDELLGASYPSARVNVTGAGANEL